MPRSEVVRLLIEFFQDSLREDACGVGDWFSRGGNDIDAFVDTIDAIESEKSY